MRVELVMRRPDQYRVIWRSRPCAAPAADGHAAPACPPDGAVWNEGDGPRSYSRATRSYRRERDDRSALAIAAGVSSGLTRGLPPLFLHGEGWFAAMGEPVVDGVATVDGEECWVVSGTVDDDRHSLWIGRESLLIRRHAYVSTPDARRAALRASSLRTAAASRDGRTDPELAFMADMEELAGRMGDTLSSETVELYSDVRTDDAGAESEMRFAPPDGATPEQPSGPAGGSGPLRDGVHGGLVLPSGARVSAPPAEQRPPAR